VPQWLSTDPKTNDLKWSSLPARRYASAVFATATCPDVCLSVRLSHAGIVRKRCILDTKLLWDGNRKPYASYRMVSLSMTLSDPWPRSQGHSSFKRRISRKRCILHTKLLDLDLDSTRIQMDALGHTPTPFWSVERSSLWTFQDLCTNLPTLLASVIKSVVICCMLDHKSEIRAMSSAKSKSHKLSSPVHLIPPVVLFVLLRSTQSSATANSCKSMLHRAVLLAILQIFC